MYCSIKEEARSLRDICLHQDAKRFKHACSLTGGSKALTPPPEIDPDTCAPETGDVKEANEVCINSIEQIACHQQFGSLFVPGVPYHLLEVSKYLFGSNVRQE